ncbi:hypothetical protein AC578_3434 [Pseudocercospora eumusae]|uniref:Uncharacterized protein n=1 Tax=Pseudocercospora eumusae TaxID=321146 RepID=A0A139HR54_9PEZI|nr:hypothetical protein AC578_3434 [Pseudocercospora eumusae]
MHYIKSILLALSVLTMVSASAVPNPEANPHAEAMAIGDNDLINDIPLDDDALEERSSFDDIPLGEDLDLAKRALTKCPKSNGCKCKKIKKRGQFCGYTSTVTILGRGGALDHVYECNTNGACCDYGYARRCK